MHCCREGAGAGSPQRVDKLAAVIRISNGVRVPLDLEALEFGTALRQSDDDLVDVDTCAHSQEPAVCRAAHQHPSDHRTRQTIIARITYRVAQKSKPLPNYQKIVLNRIKVCQ